ncbi:MAG: HlyD family secretion protein [Planctomycetaceae bacterium]
MNYTRLNRWHGTPLDPENEHCFVEQGTELLSIAPTDQIQAVLYIDQGDRDDLQDQMEVELKLDHLPDITYTAPVTVISPRGEEVAPEARQQSTAVRWPPRLASRDRKKLASKVFRATVEMHFDHPESTGDDFLIKPGMRGNARFLVSHRTAWDWGKRYFFETFRFRL